MKYLDLWSSGLRNFFEKFVKPSGPPPAPLVPLFTYLIYVPLANGFVKKWKKFYLKYSKACKTPLKFLTVKLLSHLRILQKQKWDVMGRRRWGLVSVLDVQSLFFFIKENWILAMTRHHANNILTRDLHFDSDVRQWSHLLMILLHGLWAKSNVTWICFCLHFVHSHARCGCFILFYP